MHRGGVVVPDSAIGVSPVGGCGSSFVQVLDELDVRPSCRCWVTHPCTCISTWQAWWQRWSQIARSHRPWTDEGVARNRPPHRFKGQSGSDNTGGDALYSSKGQKQLRNRRRVSSCCLFCLLPFSMVSSVVWIRVGFNNGRPKAKKTTTKHRVSLFCLSASLLPSLFSLVIESLSLQSAKWIWTRD